MGLSAILCPPANFYPRPPRGGRLHRAALVSLAQNFYPRPPRGGRLCVIVYTAARIVISIHALREEGDDSI